MIISITGFLLLAVGLLFGCQRKLIYFPRPYIIDYQLLLTEGMVELAYEIGEGTQQSFYVPPREDPTAVPESLWVLFGGNAALSLDWLAFIENTQQPGVGYLLIEYPGYGNNPGKSTGQTIPEATEVAYNALLAHLKIDPESPPFSINVLGHSLGCAAGLLFALDHPSERMVLVSPFTSMVDMARLTVGWPLCNLILDRYDNRARLGELAGRQSRPIVTIIHGGADDIIPVGQGRALAESQSEWIQYIEVDGADHNFILTSAERQIYDAMFPEQTPGGDLNASTR